MSDTSRWFSADEFYEVPDTNIYPNISVFNRKLYTFGNRHETYLKFSKVNDKIKSQDELALLDTKSCIFKINEDEFIVVLKKKEEDKYGVIGQLNNRYIKTNKLLSYDVVIRSIEDYESVSIDELYPPGMLNFKLLNELAVFRVEKRFDEFMKHIQNGSAI